MRHKKRMFTFRFNGKKFYLSTHANQVVQHHHHYYYGATDASMPPKPSPREEAPSQASEYYVPFIRFAIYINNVDTHQRYISLLQYCYSAKEVARVVVALVQEVPGFTIDDAKTEPFIHILLSLATAVKSGTTVENFRKAITEIWFLRKN